MAAKGLDKVVGRMKAAPAAVRTGLQVQFASDGAALVKGMQERAPVKSGALRASIKAVPAASGVGVRISAGGPTTTKKVRKGVRDRDAAAGRGVIDIAILTEFGGRRERAHPFFYPTVRAAKAGIKRNAARAVKKAVQS